MSSCPTVFPFAEALQFFERSLSKATGTSWWQPWVFCCSFSKLNKSSKVLMFTFSCLTMPLVVNSSRSTWPKYMEWSEWWRSQTPHPAAHVSLLTELNSGSSWTKQQGERRCRWRKSNIFRWLNSGLTFKSLAFSGEKLWKLVPLAPRFTQAETGCARRPPPTLLWARTGRSGNSLESW